MKKRLVAAAVIAAAAIAAPAETTAAQAPASFDQAWAETQEFFVDLLEEQSNHIAWVINEADKRQASTVEPSEEGQAAWVDQVLEKAVMRVKFLEECTPGYYNNEGKAGERAAQNAPYGGGSVEYFEILDKWRTAGEMEGLELN